MFGISEQNILESADEPVVRGDDGNVIATLPYNQTQDRLTAEDEERNIDIGPLLFLC